jgi:hypothetical protein
MLINLGLASDSARAAFIAPEQGEFSGAISLGADGESIDAWRQDILSQTLRLRGTFLSDRGPIAALSAEVAGQFSPSGPRTSFSNGSIKVTGASDGLLPGSLTDMQLATVANVDYRNAGPQDRFISHSGQFRLSGELAAGDTLKYIFAHSTGYRFGRPLIQYTEQGEMNAEGEFQLRITEPPQVYDLGTFIGTDQFVVETTVYVTLERTVGSTAYALVDGVTDQVIGIPGDTDFDGDIDLTDLNNVRNNMGGTGLGDTTPFDGIVGLEDLNAVRNNLGASSMPFPEPSTVALLSLAASLLVAIRLASCPIPRLLVPRADSRASARRQTLPVSG